MRTCSNCAPARRIIEAMPKLVCLVCAGTGYLLFRPWEEFELEEEAELFPVPSHIKVSGVQGGRRLRAARAPPEQDEEALPQHRIAVTS
ncbi:hypothetical protein HPB48_013766 [Haemaphysalis longicornis]|uniref:Uncharacterized protein n=1 Tax=Haemaphysalis longicornis TaxID=44386 RepID=A0A9J6FMU1_HAELO|nr:hypothetical protein HPB48_013766 [Haemaphysalis longicornis]